MDTVNKLTELCEKAADLHASQQAMPDDGALEQHRQLILDAYKLGKIDAARTILKMMSDE